MRTEEITEVSQSPRIVSIALLHDYAEGLYERIPYSTETSRAAAVKFKFSRERLPV